MGRDWDECRTEYCKKMAKSRLKLHIEYINPNFSTFINFGSVAQSVARLLCNRKVPGSNPAEGERTFFSQTWLDRT